MKSVLSLAAGIDPFHFWMRTFYVALTFCTCAYSMGWLS
jgi:hypothetical protein